jgi:hypothetical protein
VCTLTLSSLRGLLNEIAIDQFRNGVHDGFTFAVIQLLLFRRAVPAFSCLPWLLAYLGVGVVLVLATCLPATEPARLLVPAYGDPCCGSGRDLWSALIDAARPGTLEVILNPNSGPGTAPLAQSYIQADGQSGPLLDLAHAGASILGYVHTAWGQRELAQVLDEVDRYFDESYYRGADFQLSGLFVDEMSNELADMGYYQSIRQHVRTKSLGAIVVGNPGTASIIDSSNGAAGWTIDDYATLYDRLVTFEGNGIVYRNQFALPTWIRQQPAARFAHIIHSETSLEKMRLNIQLAATRNVGTLFVTDDVLPNPYDRVPAYWNELLAAIVPPVSIDELTAAIRAESSNHNYDLNRDGQVNQQDRRYWVESIANTTWGDANLDGRFDSQDLIQVLQSGRYEDTLAPDSSWPTGDWDGDGRFNSADLLLAFQQGGYENAAVLVAEPSTSAGNGLVYALVWIAAGIRGSKKSCRTSK